MKKKKICFIVSSPGSAKAFFTDHIKALHVKYDIYLVANFNDYRNCDIEGLKGIKHIPIRREISIFKDIKAVYLLTSYFYKMKFDAVHSVTPKAGLITSLAARISGIKHRIHIFTGQVWATRKGVMRTLLKSIDKVIASLDNQILVDGNSQRKFLISQHVINEKKSVVLGAGSICGANIEKFNPSSEEKIIQRKALNIEDEKVVFTFMGRLNHDKGIYELLNAFNKLVTKRQNSYLLIFGSDEEKCIEHINEYPNILEGVNFQYCGSTSTPNLSLQAADVFCLPSYREGFGMSALEAACLGLPVICSDTYGLGDTMIDKVTGLRCKVGDANSLEEVMMQMYDHPNERKIMGENGRKRVLEHFSGEKIIGAWLDFYKNLLD